MSTSNFGLRFEPDPRTDLPHLVDDHDRLAAGVHAAWEADLKARCNNQSLRGGEVIEFQATAKNLPRRYRVRAEPGPSNRMPTYFLDPLDSVPALDPAPAGNGRTEPALNGVKTTNIVPTRQVPPVQVPLGSSSSWIDGLLAEFDHLIHESELDRYGLHGLEVLQEELREVAERHPRELLLVLISGFALSGKLACASDPAEASRGRCYEIALEALKPSLRNVAVDSDGGLGALVGAVSRLLGLRRGG